MNKLKKNKMFPFILTLLNMGFWVCFRYQPKFFQKHPVALLIRDPWIQLFTFMILGITLTWLFWKPALQKRKICLKSLGVGIGFLIFQILYNFAGDTPTYQADFRMMTAGLVSGTAVFYFADRLSPSSDSTAEEETVFLDSLSTYRSHLMGLAMLYIILFHITFLKVRFGIGLIDFFAGSGNSGVDIFIFLSGLGMIYSLSKNFKLKEFYKKRLLRIYPGYIPLVGLYSLVCMKAGLCSIRLLLANCAGISFWFSSSPCAFNWYVPAILLFYLLTPGIFLLLKNGGTRQRNAVILCVLAILLLIINIDFIKVKRLNVAFSRFPVYILGMLAGFWLLEKRSIRKSEYDSLIPIFFVCILLAYVKSHWHIPIIGWHWLLYAIIMPAFCLIASRIMTRVNAGSPVMRFLSWTGKNSFLIYLLNIIIVRFIRMFFLHSPENTPLTYNLYALVSTALVFLLVYLYLSFKKYLMRKMKIHV